MKNPLISKLEHFTRLSPADKRWIEDVSKQHVRKLGPREDIIGEGDNPKVVNLVLTGWAYRYKHLEDGRRQIIGFFLPGDLCDLNVYVLREMDHSVGTINNVTVAEISAETFTEMTLEHPRVMQALWWETLVSNSIQREWTVSLGQRHAFERIAHLMCELFIRLRSAGMTNGNSCGMPITQADIADASGLSIVHANRVLQELRARGLIVLKSRILTIPDLASLMMAAQFNSNYLHLDHEGAYLDANE